MKILSCDLNRISEFKLKFRNILVILLFTAVYFICFFYLSQRMRHLLFVGIALTYIFLIRPKPEFWLPILPLVFIMGGATLPFGEFNPAVATIVLIAFTFFYIADRILRNRPLFVPSRYLLFFVIAILIQVSSVFISIHHHGQYAWNAIRDGSSIFLFFPLAVIIPSVCKTDDSINKLMRVVVITLLVATIIGVMQYFSITTFSRVDRSLGYLYRGRVASFFGNPNIFAGYLELCIPLALALSFRERDIRWKIVAITAVILGVLSVLFTFSRGGLICMFIGCGITIMYIFRKRIWVPVLIGLVAVFILIRFAGTFERQMSFFMNPGAHMNQPTILHRYVSYRGFIEQFLESPETGLGYGARPYYWGRTRIYSFWEVRFCVSTETIPRFGGLNSLFFNNAVKGGIVSLVSLLLVITAVFAAFFKALKNGKGLLAVALAAGIFSFMCHQVIDNVLRFPTVNSIFWIITGLLLVFAKSGISSGTGTQSVPLKLLGSNREKVYDTPGG